MYFRIKIIYFFLFILALISPPFVFSQIEFFGREVRGLLGFLILIFLFLEIRKFKILDIIFFLSISIIIFLEIIFQRSDLNNILSVYFIFLIAFLLFKVLKMKDENYVIFLKFWVRFSLTLSIAAIISFLIHQFTNYNLNFLNLNSYTTSFNEVYDYKIGIFGFTIDKNFGGYIVLERVCSFFSEPQYAGFFFGFNVLLAINNYKLKLNKYLVLNSIAGLLTFSISFYFVFIILLISSLRSSQVKLLILLTMFIVSLFTLIYFLSLNINIDQIQILTSTSSLIDRYERNLSAIKLIYNASMSNLIFGHGINNYMIFNEDELGRGLSSGILYLLFEFGLLITFIFIAILISLSGNDKILILISLIYLILMPWYRYHFFWYIIILCGLKYLNSFSKNTIINKID